MSIFKRGEGPAEGDTGAPAAASAEAEPTGGSPRIRAFMPGWYRRAGVLSWHTIGIVIVLIGLVFALRMLATLVVPTLFAILLGATFLPLVDWLERHRVGRVWGALLVMTLVVLGAFGLLVVMTVGIVDQWPVIEDEVQSGLDWVNDTLQRADIDPDLINSAKETLTQSASGAAKGLLGGAVKGISTFATFLFAVFIGLNILVYVLVGGRKIGRWLSTHMGPVPPPVGYSILSNSARFLRGYIWGSTLIGIFNGAVVGVGALVIGTPLAFTIAIVQWFSNYIPMFGAFIGGAFAVLVALGTQGIGDAIWMLIFVLIANGPLQTVLSQFALGASLKLSGLVVLFATTGGAIVAGALGGVFAAPFVKICVDAYGLLKDAGLFDDEPEAADAAVMTVAAGGGGGPPGVDGPPAGEHAGETGPSS